MKLAERILKFKNEDVNEAAGDFKSAIKDAVKAIKALKKSAPSNAEKQVKIIADAVLGLASFK